jgi:hypothetical protein
MTNLYLQDQKDFHILSQILKIYMFIKEKPIFIDYLKLMILIIYQPVYGGSHMIVLTVLFLITIKT